MKILLATGNDDKARELSAMIAETTPGLDLEILTLKDFPEVKPVEEDGRTIEQNAVKKAVVPALQTKMWTLADDTGLEVECLGGGPGVYSARYAGEDADYKKNCDKLLVEMEGIATGRRGAAFRCVVALASPEGTVRIMEGRLDGKITLSPIGANGFGYDPLFFVPDAGKTLAEMTPEEKNTISHRARAIRAIIPLLKQI